MPSYPLNQFTDLEEMMCKQLLSLDLMEQNRPLSMAMRTPGCIGQRSNSSFSLSSLCLSSESSDDIYPSSNQWTQPPDSPLSSQLPNSAQWGKAGFLAQRSISMVETNSNMSARLGWPGSDMKLSQCDLSTTALSTSPTLSGSGSASASSSSRYKTELCRSFTENGLCKYGSKCQFAHGLDELRDLNRHPKYKTEPCRTFHTIGFCPYGIRCHFVHNNEEEKKQEMSRSSSSSAGIPSQASTSRPNRPPLIRHSFSFAGFPSVPQQSMQPAFPPHPGSAFTRTPSASPPACADITDLLSQVFLETAFEASPGHQQYQPPKVQASAGDPRSPFLPSPDSGCSSPILRQSPGASGVFGPLGTRSLSYTSLSDQDQDGGSSSSSLSGSEPCCGRDDASGRRLAVFSQLSVPDDTTGFCL